MDLGLDFNYEEEKERSDATFEQSEKEKEKDMEKLEYAYEGKTYHIDRELAERYAWRMESAKPGEERFNAEIECALSIAIRQLKKKNCNATVESVDKQVERVMRIELEAMGG